MIPPGHVTLSFRPKAYNPVRCLTSCARSLHGGRTALYRRIQAQSRTPHSLIIPPSQSRILNSSHRLHVFDQVATKPFSSTTRICAISYRDLKSDSNSTETPKPSNDKKSEGAGSAKEEDPAEKAYRKAQEESEANRAYSRQSEKEEKPSSEDEGERNGF